MNTDFAEPEVSLSDLVAPVLRRWRTVVLVGLFAVTLVVLRLVVVTPQYEAQAKLIVLAPNEAVADLQTLQLYRNLVPAYREILSSRRVMETVLAEMNLGWSPEEYRKRVRIEEDEQSQTLEVRVRAPSPEEAARIATGAAQIMTRVAADIMQEERLVLLDPAAPPEKPVSPRPLLEMAVATVMGLLVGTGVAFALETLDRRIRDEASVERRLGLPVLGVIPHIDL
ncbi:YveK family protein [Thermaerobacter composti]|uniref:Wzz/FepE/Etk N-terminal domain-containing protein n=1 Tax=Thermaerobacter composti TaxID=554949 RepID=A0ABZ0QSH6_9FIRM|nr:Wzz/FepE/Etk N-terminal domain-containing protein [Thermaerobacter composti]WPD19727.1 Wzz/FepE/Etk N-terminal domain-containing protein [Thermaerobacter composti]